MLKHSRTPHWHHASSTGGPWTAVKSCQSLSLYPAAILGNEALWGWFSGMLGLLRHDVGAGQQDVVVSEQAVPCQGGKVGSLLSSLTWVRCTSAVDIQAATGLPGKPAQPPNSRDPEMWQNMKQKLGMEQPTFVALQQFKMYTTRQAGPDDTALTLRVCKEPMHSPPSVLKQTRGKAHGHF